MASLQEYAVGVSDILRPHDELDVLLYYGLVSRKLGKFLHGLELATRTWLPRGRISRVVKRGSRDPPLYIEQLIRSVTPELMEVRKQFRHLEKVRHVLSSDQALVWFYFVPRKYMGFYYATNREGEGREITRAIYDIDRGRGVNVEDAIEVAAQLVQAFEEDERAPTYFRGGPFVAWTGRSFQVTLFLKELQPASFYTEHLEYTGSGRTFTDRWVSLVAKQTNARVTGGHQRPRNFVVIDPSQTPSGKLCRVPLGSLHMKDALRIEGISVPLTLDMLHQSVIPDLLSYTPEKIIHELDDLGKRLPR